MTGGAEGTETVSFLAYRQVISRTALGLGSAVSVLLFLSLTLLAVALARLLRVDLGGGGRTW
jgi:multiple sugar transport system permease protein